MRPSSFFQDKNRSVRLNILLKDAKIELKLLIINPATKKQINNSEHSSDADFPKTLVLQYSKQRGQTYLLCSDGNRSCSATVAAILL